MYNDKKKAANARSDKKNTKQYIIKLTLSTDADIITKLDAVENRNGYLKNLIRNDLKTSK